MAGSARRRFGRYTLELSNLEKVLFAREGITKRDLLEYYERIARVMLPYLRKRALTLQRFPDGLDEEGFYQQRRSDYFPDFVGGSRAQRVAQKETINHIVCKNQAALVYLANQGTVTFHRWLSRIDKISRPDSMVFDLDPPASGGFREVCEAAMRVGRVLEDAGYTPYYMTTGSSGIHVLSPLRRTAGFEQVRQSATTLAKELAGAHPDLLTTEQRKADRGDRIYLDTGRNAYGQTAVVPYSVRARQTAPIATPLSEKELERSDLNARSYDIRNIFKRLGQIDDPWQGMRRHAVALKSPRC